ncbi:DUF11 domain-containing protein [Kribbella turkmenica]|uniref:DUF11 domain-containing protein n=2 Tax=Kribbella turkmenica TaxID=2530375 RepID=A0A4R4X9I0_9ACTN|nr:DUF11 domain-containing protein [Kribbella turkmenica]
MVGAGLVAIPQLAAAAPPSSVIELSPTAARPGDTFTVTQTLHNDRAFTVTGAKAGLYGKESPLPGLVDLVSCPGAFACDILGGSIRGGFGDMASGETRTVVFTLRVKDTAPAGPITLQHQFIGENYAFETLDGPVLTILPAVPDEADLAVSLAASARGLPVSRITYTVTVKNNGPGDATGLRVTGTYPAGLVYAGSSNCARVAGTRTVNCDFPALASGATTTSTFAADAGLLALGSLTATANRTASAPADPNAANDQASTTCRALTSLIVRC